MADEQWWNKPIRCVHFTVREVDVPGFDVADCMQQMQDCHVNLTVFSTAGYHAIYPTNIPLNRRSPWLGDRDLIGELIEEGHRRDIKVGIHFDGSSVPANVLAERPEWFVRDREGNPRLITHQYGDLFASCGVGDYLREHMVNVIGELLGRYQPDAVFLNGMSFHTDVCYCEHCRAWFKRASGYDLPTAVNWESDQWRAYARWKTEAVTDTMRHVREAIRAMNPALPVTENTTFHLHASAGTGTNFYLQAPYVDFVKTEAQTRVSFAGLDRPVDVQPFSWPAEEGRFFNTVTDKNSIITISHWYASSWRRGGVPYHFQKLWLAECFANGSSVHFHMGGPPKVQEDQRGLPALEEIYGWVERNEDAYTGVEPYTDTAVALSFDTIQFYGKEQSIPRAIEPYRGYYRALNEAHIPFDVISDEILQTGDLSKYKTIVLPNVACLADQAVENLKRYVENGGGLVATWETGFYDAQGHRRDRMALADLIGAESTGTTVGPVTGTIDGRRLNGYMFVADRESPLVDGLGDTSLVINAGSLQVVRPFGNAAAPLLVQPSWEAFPEGRSYPAAEFCSVPAAVTNTHGKGRVAYFSGQIDRVFHALVQPDLRTLLVNAARWAANAAPLLELRAPMTVDVMTQRKEADGRIFVHLINVTGVRPQAEFIPLANLGLSVKLPEGAQVTGARLLSGAPLNYMQRDGRAETNVPTLVDYDVVELSVRS